MISDGIIAVIGVLSVVDLLLVCQVYKILLERINTQSELIDLLHDEINNIKQYVLIPEHINCRCETGVVFENDKRES